MSSQSTAFRQGQEVSMRTSAQSSASTSGRLLAHANIGRQFLVVRNLGRIGLTSPVESRLRRPENVLCRVTKSERRKRQQEVEVEEDEKEEEKQGFLASGAALVNTLLFGAASRIERGTSVCVSCRGTGTIMCKECEATGIVKAKKSSGQSSNRKQTFQGQKSKEFMVSNRCRNCRGHGRLECPHCDGIGKRHVVQRDMWT